MMLVMMMSTLFLNACLDFLALHKQNFQKDNKLNVTIKKDNQDAQYNLYIISY